MKDRYRTGGAQAARAKQTQEKGGDRKVSHIDFVQIFTNVGTLKGPNSSNCSSNLDNGGI